VAMLKNQNEDVLLQWTTWDFNFEFKR